MARVERAEQGTIPALDFEGKIFNQDHLTTKNASFLQDRLDCFEKYAVKFRESIAAKDHCEIDITLPDGKVVKGKAFETTPLDIAKGISNNLAKQICVAKVSYDDSSIGSCGDIVVADEESDDEGGCCDGKGSDWISWDAGRVLEGSCKLKLLKFEDEEGRNVFWHSSSHVLGEALELTFGAHLTIGPALERGFYYDSYMGKDAIKEDLYEAIEKSAAAIAKEDQLFERIVLTKTEALEVFKHNPFKVQLITHKIPDGGLTTAYKCGLFVDLCKGPHLPSTGCVKAFALEKHSSAYWLGKAKNDTLQRVYAISFPDVKQLKAHQKMLQQAKERDHRTVGNKMNLFFFEPMLTPGSAFWMPSGTQIYNKLTNLMRREYRIREFDEVITPNMYSAELFKISGHYQNYKDDMYMFEVEGKEWGLKPMNCPGHCLMFKHNTVSYKDLPWKVADFGVLHRNELSGSLSGLTRVRRFQQDDAHIFCREDQIEDEVTKALSFLQYIYSLFGFEIEVNLSTRPKKALGKVSLWNAAEGQLKNSLDASGLPWKLNPGDGAFYGPKIDIRLKDCIGRFHQCGTIQLDFQLPLRFDLSYRTSEYGKKDDSTAEVPASPATTEPAPKIEAEKDLKQVGGSMESPLKPGTSRPVIIHRAILGSLERFTAICVEHFGARFPFWLSPRQIKVLPISEKTSKYAKWVTEQLYNYGFDVELDVTDNTINKKIKVAQTEQWNYMLIVGEQEVADGTVTVRKREEPNAQTTAKVDDLIQTLKLLNEPSSKTFEFTPYSESN